MRGSHTLPSRLCGARRAGSPGEGWAWHTPVSGSSFRRRGLAVTGVLLLCPHPAPHCSADTADCRKAINFKELDSVLVPMWPEGSLPDAQALTFLTDPLTAGHRDSDLCGALE